MLTFSWCSPLSEPQPFGQALDGALLIVIFATSGALEAVATRRTEDSVRGLLDLAPAQATRVTLDGREQVVPAAELTVREDQCLDRRAPAALAADFG